MNPFDVIMDCGAVRSGNGIDRRWIAIWFACCSLFLSLTSDLYSFFSFGVVIFSLLPFLVSQRQRKIGNECGCNGAILISHWNHNHINYSSTHNSSSFTDVTRLRSCAFTIKAFNQVLPSCVCCIDSLLRECCARRDEREREKRCAPGLTLSFYGRNSAH